MKKILCLSRKDIQHPKAGGAEVVIHKYLSGLVERGYGVVQISTGFSGSEKYTTINGVQIHRRGSIHSIYFIFWLIYLWKYRNKYDIIIDHAGGIPLLSPLYIWNRPIIFFTHHVGTKERAEYFVQWIGIGRIGSMFGWIYNVLVLGLYRHKSTITVSQGTANELIKLGFNQTTVILNTSDYPRIDRVSERGLELTVVGRVVPNKQFSHAIEIIYQLHKNGLQYKLHIVGIEQDPLESKKLHDLVTSYGLEKYILFHGRISDEQLLTIRDGTKYGLIVSDKEGFGMTVLEANSRGVPVIGYDIGGVNEVIHHGSNGFLVEKNNISQVVNCIMEQYNYDDIVASTLHFINNYPTWDTNILTLEQLIKCNKIIH